MLAVQSWAATQPRRSLPSGRHLPSSSIPVQQTLSPTVHLELPHAIVEGAPPSSFDAMGFGPPVEPEPEDDDEDAAAEPSGVPFVA